MNKLLTVAEVAGILGMSEVFVRKLIQDRKLAHFKIGTAVRIPPDAVRRYLETQLRDVA